ncbi:hypothetical protein ES288_A03G155400v1 [Gossypium darwinii]|uniref:Uncharacterized protein n=2 Tax=Gossypium TaxID=3633 RepID=A0A5D2H6Y0_GOSDA|nr:hypothetical protein ES288_A03G155400v1 [Gossypium darwinii]
MLLLIDSKKGLSGDKHVAEINMPPGNSCLVAKKMKYRVDWLGVEASRVGCFLPPNTGTVFFAFTCMVSEVEASKPGEAKKPRRPRLMGSGITRV